MKQQSAAPSWQQMSVAEGMSDVETDYLGIPVRDIDGDVERNSYLEQHRVSLCAVLALLALTSCSLLFVSLAARPSSVALSPLSTSASDEAARHFSWSDFMLGRPHLPTHLQTPTQSSSQGDAKHEPVDGEAHVGAAEQGDGAYGDSDAAARPSAPATSGVFHVVPFPVSLFSPTFPSTSVFASVSAALTAARAFRSSAAVAAPLYIYLYPALHFQTSPIQLTAADSGAGQSAPLVLTTMPDEAVQYFRQFDSLHAADSGHAPLRNRTRAVLSGGRLLTGWTQTERANVYSVAVDDAMPVVNQLFVSDRRAVRSRLPSKPGDFYRVQDAPAGQKTDMRVEASVLTGISNLPQVEFVVYHSWTASRHYYKSHRADGYLQTDNPTMWDMGFKQGQYLRYSVENAKEGMDRPGTWYFDTERRTVYFWCDTPPSQLEIVVPVMDTVLSVLGEREQAKRVQWVEVRDVDIAHSSWHLARGESADYQATAWLGYATVHVQYASNVLFAGLHIAHTGSYAWWCERGCTDVTLRDSALTDTAAGGVRIGMDRLMQAGNVPPPDDVLRRVFVLNNSIHNTGLVFPDGVGVLQQRAEDCIIAHNHIHHTYYSGISAGWEWGYEASGSRNNTIAHNYIHDIGQGLLTDQAGIYTLGSSNGGVIAHNVVHNVHSWAGLDWGIYLDEGSVGWTVVDNVCYNTGWASFFLHYGRDNNITNNVFARAGPLRGDVAVDWVEKHLSLTAQRNIVYDTYQPASGHATDPHVTFEAGTGVQVVLDNNTYWAVHGLNQRFGGAKQTLAEWQASGQDVHSVYADPLFPHAEQCDFFELDPASPALKLGFTPIARLPQWRPGCGDPTPADEGEESPAALLVPASADAAEQAGKAMNTDEQAAAFLKKEKEKKEEEDKQKADGTQHGEAKPDDEAQTVEAAAQTATNTTPNAAVVQPGAASATLGVFHVVPFPVSLFSPTFPSTSVFASVSAALTAARAFRSSAAVAAPLYIYLYPALHFQTSPIQLTAADSGAGQSAPLVLTTMPDEAVQYFRQFDSLHAADSGHAPLRNRTRAVLSGGRLLTGWTQTERANVYSVAVDDAMPVVNQLFVSDRRAVRSRLPSKPGDFYRVQDAPAGQKTDMRVEASVLTGISNLPQVEFVVYHSWTASRHYYKSHRADGYLQTDNPTMWDMGFKQGQYLRYSVENAKEGMDRPGTWYFDTERRTVYFWCDTPPSQLEIVVPVMDTVLSVLGEREQAKRVQWVEVRDVDIAHSSWHLARGESADYQATAWLGYATVHVQYASNVLFAGLHIAHTGSYAWWCERGCTDVTLRDSALTDTAAGGVRIGMDRLMQAGNVPPPDDVLRRVFVLNNSIHNTGLVFPDGVGVLQQRAEDCIIAHNHIHHTYYSGISAGWEWGYEASGSRNNTIAHNYIHDIGQGLLTDQAGIYTLGSSNGGVIAHNVVHNVHSWAGLDWGIYLDEGSVGWTVVDNVCYNTGWASFFLHYGRDNNITNNVFARAGPLRGDVAVDWVEKHLSLTAQRNIVYDTYQPASGHATDPHVTFEAGTGVQVVLDNNTYWAVHGLNQRFGGAKQTLAEWQASGQDVHSVYADPLFPHAEQCDFFELDPASPALKLGFTPIARLPQWRPGCGDPTPADEGEESPAALLVPASADAAEQAGKAMNTDEQAAAFLKKEKEKKEEEDKQKADGTQPK